MGGLKLKIMGVGGSEIVGVQGLNLTYLYDFLWTNSQLFLQNTVINLGEMKPPSPTVSPPMGRRRQSSHYLLPAEQKEKVLGIKIKTKLVF